MDWNKISAVAGIGSYVLAAVLAISTHLPGGWLAGATATVKVMLTIFLAASIVLAGYLHLKAASMARQAAGEAATPPRTEAMPSRPDAPRPLQIAERVFINMTPVEVVAPFASGLTEYRARKLVEDYVDKWVRWEGRIADVNLRGSSKTPYVFALYPVERMRDVSLHMEFVPSQTAQILHLEKGATIRAEGRIESVRVDSISLVDCTVVNPPASA